MVNGTSVEHCVAGSPHITRPQVLQWCLRRETLVNSCWQNGHFDTSESSSHATTDCSRIFRWSLCHEIGHGLPAPGWICSKGRLPTSWVSRVSLFSNLETSRKFLSTFCRRRDLKVSVWSLTRPIFPNLSAFLI